MCLWVPTNLGWTVISDVAPKKLIGLTAGIFNFSANFAGIVTSLVIGFAYQSTLHRRRRACRCVRV